MPENQISQISSKSSDQLSNKNPEDKKNKYFWLILALLLFLIAFGFLLGGDKNKDNQSGVMPSPLASKPSQPGEIDFSDQETSSFQLNFKSGQLVFTGYPYVDKNFKPRLYNLIYVNTVFEADDMENLTDPSGKWQDVYEISGSEDKIFIPIGRSQTNQPIWQTMEIINEKEVGQKLPGCDGHEVKLTGDLKGITYSCAMINPSKDFASSRPCWIELGNGKGLVYKQYSKDLNVSADLCGIIKGNNIFSISFKPY